MSGVIFETAMRKFASRDCRERRDLCLFFIIRNCENAVDAKGINISEAAFEINGYSCCRLNQNSVISVSLNPVSRVASSLISINCSFAAHGI